MAVDVGLGIVGMTGYSCTCIVSFTVNPLINSKLGLTGTFYLFATINLMCGVWYYRNIKETSVGLSDKEKKSLYVPEDLKHLIFEEE